MKAAVGRVVLILVGATFGLVVGELAFRVLGYDPGGLIRFDSSLGWTARENTRWRTRRPEFDVVVRTNSYGMRGPDFPLEKPPGERRVLMLGDSQMLAREVDREETLPFLVEQGLADLGRVRVLPMGVSGWGPDQELLYLRERGLAFEPDVVMVLFHPNDFGSVHKRKLMESHWRHVYKPYFLEENGRLTLHQVPVPEAEEDNQLVRLFMERSSFASFLRQGLPGGLERWIQGLLGWTPHDRPPPPEGSPEGWSLAWRLVQEIERTAREGGARFTLLITPHRRQIEGEITWANLDWLEDQVAAAGMPHVSLRPLITSSSDYIPRDQHWAPEAHAAAARAVTPLIRRLLVEGS